MALSSSDGLTPISIFKVTLDTISTFETWKTYQNYDSGCHPS